MTQQPPQGQQPEPGTQPPVAPQPPVTPRPPTAPQPQWGQQPQWGEQPQWGQPPPQWGSPQDGAPATPPPPAPAGQPGWGQPGTGYPVAPLTPKPGIIPLRPIGLGEIYDGAFQAIRTNPRTMIGLSAVVIAIATLVTLLPQAWMLTSLGSLMSVEEDEVGLEELSSTLAALPTFFLSALVQTAAVTVLAGMLIIAVSAAVLGRRTSPSDLWARTKARVPALIGLFLLTMLLLTVLTAVLAAPGILVLALASGTGARVGGVVAVVVGLLVAIGATLSLGLAWWSCAAPSLLLEDQGVLASLRRSMKLVRRSFWRVFGIQLLTLVLASIAGGLIAAPFSIASAVLPVIMDVDPYGSFGIALVTTSVDGLGQVVSGAIVSPFQAAVTALLYIDLRMRREGLDLELIRASATDAAR